MAIDTLEKEERSRKAWNELLEKATDREWQAEHRRLFQRSYEDNNNAFANDEELMKNLKGEV